MLGVMSRSSRLYPGCFFVKTPVVKNSVNGLDGTKGWRTAPRAAFCQRLQAEYFEVLSVILEQSYPYLDRSGMFVPPNLVVSWLNDSEGKMLLVDAEGNRIPTDDPG